MKPAGGWRKMLYRILGSKREWEGIVQEPLKCPVCNYVNPAVSIPFFHGIYNLDRFRSEHTIVKNVLCKACGAELVLVFRLESVEQA